MRKSKKLIFGTLLATAAVLLAACAPQPGESTPAGSGDAGSGESSGPAEISVGIVTSETGRVVSINLLTSATVIRGLFARRKIGETPRPGQKRSRFRLHQSLVQLISYPTNLNQPVLNGLTHHA